MQLLRLVLLALVLPFAAHAQDLSSRMTEGHADSAGVRIHDATLGNPEDPPVLMIHGFPDYWYSWRALMADLARDHFTIAIDQRGYNLSGQPAGEQNYQLKYMVGDVAAVLRQLGLASTWQWVDNRLTVVTLPHVGHFVLRDAPTQVIPLVRDWLAR